MKEREGPTVPSGAALPPAPVSLAGALPAAASEVTLPGAAGLAREDHDRARTLIEPTAWAAEDAGAIEVHPFDSPKLVIPGYRIVRLIGQGGMGVVYEAEQDHPRRRVALKLIRGGPFAGEQRVKLFEREMHALARLRHPAIAGIYHAGHTACGEPFFTMELARGVTLDEAVRTGSAHGTALAKLDARLRLFANLCEAVNYAHQRGVVHRDLKPANILVGASLARSSEAALPEVKILDFGLARITDPDFVSSMVTQGAVVRGTLAYMSPEQARGCSDDIDLRADVYSLGVILYELVAGTLPYALANSTPHEAMRTICEQAPGPLRGRRARVGRPAVAEDLATIIFKALEKEPQRRYQSALALAEDLQRQLADQPILARSPSAVYQFRKLVRRNRAAAALVGALFVTILASTVFMAVQRNRARVAAEQARSEGAEAIAVKDFLKGILTAGQSAQTGRDARVLDVLQDAASRLPARMQQQPKVEAALHDTLSESFFYLGQYDHARQQAEAAVAIHARLFSKDHLATLKSMDNLVAALMGQGRFPEAETLAREVIERKQALLSAAHRETLASMFHLSSILLYRGKTAAAEVVARQISDVGQRVLPPGDEVTLNGMNDLGVALRKQKRFDESETLLRRALELCLRARSEEHPVTLQLMTNLLGALLVNGKLDEAEQLTRRTLALKQRVLGPAHAETIVTQSGLARMLCKQKRAEGELMLRDLVRLVSAPSFESLNPPEMYTGRLGKCVADFGRWAEAEALLLSSYEGLRAKLGADDNRTKDIRDALVALYAAWGKPKKVALWRERPGLGM